MRRNARSTRAFTIVEMLVVISIVAILIGLLLPALNSARNRARKTGELNNLRQVHIAWNLYANSNADATLPGYLEAEVQQRWRVSYKYIDGSKIPPAPDFSGSDPNIAGPWTWRLLPYLDYSHEIVHGYKNEAAPDQLDMQEPEEAEDIAEHPAYGYNGHYIGGYYEIVVVPDPNGGDPIEVPRTRFTSAEGFTSTSYSTGVKNLVARNISAIGRSNEVITFCSSSELPAGIVRETLDDIDGCDLVHPPLLAFERQWGMPPQGGIGGGATGLGDTTTRSLLEVFVDDCPVPIARYTDSAAVLFADGHLDQIRPLTLNDMRYWVDHAVDAGWRHR